MTLSHLGQYCLVTIKHATASTLVFDQLQHLVKNGDPALAGLFDRVN